MTHLTYEWTDKARLDFRIRALDTLQYSWDHVQKITGINTSSACPKCKAAPVKRRGDSHAHDRLRFENVEGNIGGLTLGPIHLFCVACGGHWSASEFFRQFAVHGQSKRLAALEAVQPNGGTPKNLLFVSMRVDKHRVGLEREVQQLFTPENLRMLGDIELQRVSAPDNKTAVGLINKLGDETWVPVEWSEDYDDGFPIDILWHGESPTKIEARAILNRENLLLSERIHDALQLSAPFQRLQTSVAHDTRPSPDDIVALQKWLSAL